jgi:hypothetical protein
VLAPGGLCASGDPLVNKYDALHAAAISKCQSIDAEVCQNGLCFQPGWVSFVLCTVAVLSEAGYHISRHRTVRPGQALPGALFVKLGILEIQLQKLVSAGHRQLDVAIALLLIASGISLPWRTAATA